MKRKIKGGEWRISVLHFVHIFKMLCSKCYFYEIAFLVRCVTLCLKSLQGLQFNNCAVDLVQFLITKFIQIFGTVAFSGCCCCAQF